MAIFPRLASLFTRTPQISTGTNTTMPVRMPDARKDLGVVSDNDITLTFSENRVAQVG